MASVVATVVLSRFGLAGTLLGAALAPMILALVKELGRRQAEVIIARAPVPRDGRRRTSAEPAARPRVRRPSVRWGVVAATTAIALAVSVAAITVPELIAGRAVVADRPTTFFSSGSGGGDDGAPAPAADEADEPAATTTAAPAEEPAETAPSTTDPAVTATDAAPDATTAPEADPGAAPAATDGSVTPVAPAPPAPEAAPPAP